jgi:hypothetical protein
MIMLMGNGGIPVECLRPGTMESPILSGNGKMMRIRIPLGYPRIVQGAALLLGLLLGVHLLLPYVVNTASVRRMVLERASEAYNGEISFSSIKPALLPWPHVRITQGRLSDGRHNTLIVPKAAVYLKIWPLLTGRLRIDRIKLIKPAWRVDMGVLNALVTGGKRPGPADSTLPGILTPLIGGLGNVEARIVNGRFDLRRDGRSVIRASALSGRVASLDGQIHLKMRCITNLSEGVVIDADLDGRSLNGGGSLAITGLRSQVLPALGLIGHSDDVLQAAMDLDVDITTFGLERFQARFNARSSRIRAGRAKRRVTVEDISISGRAEWNRRKVDIALLDLQSASPAMKWSGSFSWTKDRPMAHPPIQISLKGANLEIPSIRDSLLKLFGGQPVVERVLDIVREGKVPAVTLEVSAPDWQELKGMKHLRAACYLTGGRIKVPNDLFDLKHVSGHVTITGGRLAAHGISARQGNAVASQGELTMGLYDGSRVFSLDTLIDADVGELPGLLINLVRNQEILSHLQRLPEVTGRASGRLTVGDHLDRFSTEIVAKARIETGATALDLVGVIKDPPDQQPSANLFMNGRVGPAIMEWLLQFGEAPAIIAPQTPLTVSGADIALSPSGRLRLNGVGQWDDGARIGAALTFSEGDFHMQQLRIRDAVSDALLSCRFRRSGREADLRFSGHLEASTLGRFGVDHGIRSGAVHGRFRAFVDRDRLGATLLNGELAARDLEYHHGDGGVVHIMEASINGHGGRFDLPRVSLTWDKSSITLAADGRFTPQAIDVQGTVQADTVHTQKILAAFGSDPSQSSPDPSAAAGGLALPVEGRLQVAVDRLIHDRYRLSAVRATIEVKDRETTIDVTDADLCGIQMPGRVRMSDGLTHLAFTPVARASSLKEAGSCLVGYQNSEKLLGTLNLNGNFSTRGRNRQALFANLKGAVEFTVEKGRVSNIGSAGVFTNLLSYLSVNQYVRGDLPDPGTDDFSFKRIESRWVFDNGSMQIEESVLKSNSVNIVAEGQYDPLSKELDLVALVSPLTTVDWIVDRIPILGHILQGTLVAIPVRIKGPRTDPKVLPLSPTAVGKRLGGILKRTLKTPVRIIEPLLKDDPGQDPGTQ